MSENYGITHSRLSIIFKFLRDTYGDVFQLHLPSQTLCLLSECMNTYVTVKLPMVPFYESLSSLESTTDGVFEFDYSTLWTLVQEKLPCSQSSSLLIFKIEKIDNRKYLGVANWPANNTEVKVLLRPGNASRILNILPLAQEISQYQIGPVLVKDLSEWLSYGFASATTFVDLKITGKNQVTIISHQIDVGTFIVKNRETNILQSGSTLCQQDSLANPFVQATHQSSQHFDAFVCTQGCRLVSFDAKQIQQFLGLFPEAECKLQCSIGEPLRLVIADMTMIVVPYDA